MTTHSSLYRPYAAIAFLVFTLATTFVSAQDIQRSPSIPELARYEFEMPSMGTTLQIILYADDEASAQRAVDKAILEIDRLAQIVSNYDPASEIMKLNASRGQSSIISDELSEIFSDARRWYELSDGKFDITCGAVFQLWKKSRKTNARPVEADLQLARSHSGWSNLKIVQAPNPNGLPNHDVATLNPGCMIDLSGLATGFIIDRMMDKFAADNIRSVLINIGGDIRLGDAPPDAEGWQVQIAGLGKNSPPLMKRFLSKCAITTSGDLTQYVVIDGKRYSHLVDPMTSEPLTRRQSATVVAETCLDADAGATALSILGMEAASARFDELPILEAILLEASEANALEPSNNIRFRYLVRE